MAGGVGSRFWPASREAKPKQFLDILGTGKSLLQMTYERFLPFVPGKNIFVVSHEKYTSLILKQIPDMDKSQVIEEPSRNNTAPCILYAALKLHGLNPSANMVVAPADHLILKEDVFLKNIGDAISFCESTPSLCTLGITPNRPDTGYGYILFSDKEESNACLKVEAFTEKPDLATAEKFLDHGNYLWNAGIFVWSLKTIISAFRNLAPEVYDVLYPIADKMNSVEESEAIRKTYPNTPKISVDYAIMEKAKNVYTIPSDIGWSDLGTWKSLHSISQQDESGNLTSGSHVYLDQVKDSVIRMPNDKLAVIRGLNHYMIIDEEDVLLIYPLSDEQRIKTEREKIHEKFK